MPEKTDMEKKEELRAWMLEGWARYERRNKTRLGSNEMAVKIKMPPQTWNRYLKMESLPDLTNIIKLDAAFGPNEEGVTIYDVMEIPHLMPADPRFNRIASAWPTLTDSEKEALLKNLAELKEAKEARNPAGVPVNA